ncbi:c-type cytochrome [Xanthomonas hortorum]|uniref:c-type cytochrome n=1 Tax=Xanthomonas hortorum TaxID=56454 RepID=UPI002936BE6B|nr:cytochrome c [Xanthomonas hortorum]MDV2449390.1 cytochrome c [Xanthomonas hortorum NBC5720]
MTLFPRLVAGACMIAWGSLLMLSDLPHAQAQGPAGALRRSAVQGLAKASGKEVYQVICQGCHMPAGQGARGAGEYPALAGNSKLAAAPYVTMMVLKGHGGMPGFGSTLNDRQVAEVVSYVRTHFGNDYGEVVTIDDVKSLRH